MEKPELTLEDIVFMVKAAEGDFLIFVDLSEEGDDGNKEESLQT